MAAYSNKVVEFGGGDEYITAGNVLGFERTDTQSWSFWAQWGAATYGMFLAKSTAGDTGFYIYHTPTGAISVVLQGSGGGYIQKTSTVSGLNDGQYRHYVVTYDGSSGVDGIKIYADNVDITAAGGVNTLSTSIVTTAAFTVGRYGGASYFFVGRMDEVAVYGGTLTPAEVTWIYNGKVPRSLNDVGAPTGRRVWWRMGEGATHPTIPDEGGTFPGTMVTMESGDIKTDQIAGFGGVGIALDFGEGSQGGFPGVVLELGASIPPTPFVPVIGSWSPAVGSTVLRGDPISFEVTDTDGNLARVVVTAVFPWGSEVIHNGTAFSPAYDNGSTRTAITNGYAFTVARDVGWGGPAMSLDIYATDTTGAEATPTSYAFTCSDPVIPDTDPPVIDNWNPAPGTELGEFQPISFDVTDGSGAFRRIVVHAVFADGIEEVVHDGDQFRGLYQHASTRQLITGGLRYTVLRFDGWPSSPATFRVFAIDPDGNEGT